jgi:DNA-binding CsgD family transcriptional regulator
LAFGAGLLAASRNFVEAWSIARSLMEAAQGRSRVDAAMAAGFSLRGMGRGDEAVTLVDRAMAEYAAWDDVTVLTTQVLGSVKTVALLDLGRLDEGDAAAAATIEAATRTGDTAALALALNCSGWSNVYRGRYFTARDCYLRAVSLLGGLGRRGQLRWALIGAFFAVASAGDVPTATRLAAEVDELGLHPATMFDGQLARAHASLLVATGEPERARALLTNTANESAATDDFVTEAACWHDLVRFGRPELARERLGELRDRIDGAWVPLFARHAAAAADRDGNALGEVARQFTDLGAVPFAVDAARGAADAAARAGDQRAASRWSMYAAELATGIEGSRDVSATGLGGADPLTRREREVAELAAQGLASKAIAERLFVSTRTVDSHLLRVYTKLGVRSRTELAGTLTGRSA